MTVDKFRAAIEADASCSAAIAVLRARMTSLEFAIVENLYLQAAFIAASLVLRQLQEETAK